MHTRTTAIFGNFSKLISVSFIGNLYRRKKKWIMGKVEKEVKLQFIWRRKFLLACSFFQENYSY